MEDFVIKNNIAFYRKKLGLTQMQLANLVGVTKNAIYDFEHEIYYPTLVTAVKIYNALERPSDLFFVQYCMRENA